MRQQNFDRLRKFLEITVTVFYVSVTVILVGHCPHCLTCADVTGDNEMEVSSL